MYVYSARLALIRWPESGVPAGSAVAVSSSSTSVALPAHLAGVHAVMRVSPKTRLPIADGRHYGAEMLMHIHHIHMLLCVLITPHLAQTTPVE
jgi:histidinol dehydrogenase